MLPIALLTILSATQLPAGSAPAPVPSAYFPDTLHTFVWRNWQLVPLDRMAEVVGATPEQLRAVGESMGLSGPPEITAAQQERSYITVIRRNWHLLPYDQLMQLLGGWSAEKMAFTLREDDFLYIKLGSLKPQCEPLRYEEPDDAARARAQEIAAVVREELPQGVGPVEEPLFQFVEDLSQPPAEGAAGVTSSGFNPRYCYSYFALYGDPFMDEELTPYPDGYLQRLANAGVSGVWLQAVLSNMAPFPWDANAATGDEEKRLENLNRLASRIRSHGLGLYLYLNEPRSLPLAYFETHPELKGVVEGDYAALCTSNSEVRQWMADTVELICRAAPDLAGFFTITASENLTNCWSHHQGASCPKCAPRGPAEVIAEVNATIQAGIDAAGGAQELIAWDWGWQDEWSVDTINKLPTNVALQSVSEWSIPISRGGIDSVVGEYSISTIGPGPRATRHWKAAQERGMRTVAKIQAGNTWELSAVPYIPALRNVAQHAANLRETDVDGLMLGWTLGGYPSPNLEVVAAIGGVPNAQDGAVSMDEALHAVARRRYGAAAADAVVTAWRAMSEAFSEFPYNGGLVYSAPLQMGPANPLYAAPTGYAAAMVGIPYDDLNRWRAVYPVDVFIGQLLKVADGFDAAIAQLKLDLPAEGLAAGTAEAGALRDELSVQQAAANHFRSVANQALFVSARDALAAAQDADAARPLVAQAEAALLSELSLARGQYALQCADSRLGFEASNHYFYVPGDLAEKVINCRHLLATWLPETKAKFGL